MQGARNFNGIRLASSILITMDHSVLLQLVKGYRGLDMLNTSVTAICRGENKGESIHDHHNLTIVEKNEGLKSQKDYDKEGRLLLSSSPKRQKVRKGVALRAPLF
ncbi:hypothetical protein RHMOL_Rhmol09G0047500 [Rhododendron molle]|uniref:Uncharacterized protein n=1 Tax=Rhododendron molle TaxID=49168 RepID=A0ACC0MBF1_RHOML|nr:hypothetical protein RHMOL_Rhmol09G0047500 [Rhododendron molle]